MAAATSGTGNVGTEEITRTPFFIAVVMIVYHLTHQLSSGRRPGTYTPQKSTTRRPSAAAPSSATSPVTHGGRTADLTGQASPPAAIPTGSGLWPLARRAVPLGERREEDGEQQGPPPPQEWLAAVLRRALFTPSAGGQGGRRRLGLPREPRAAVDTGPALERESPPPLGATNAATGSGTPAIS